MKLNEKILHYRKAAKLSQEELAALVGVSRQAVSKWELGDATPEVDKLLALAKAFGVTTDELLSGEEPAGAQGRTPPPREETPVYTVPGAPAGDNFDRATGLIGRLIRRYGWLAGVYIAVGGLPITIIGALARWGFGAMFAASSDMMDSMGGFGGLGGMGGVEFSAGSAAGDFGGTGHGSRRVPPERHRGLLPGRCHRRHGGGRGDDDRRGGTGGLALPKRE